MPNQYKRLTDLEKLQLMKEEIKKREEGLTETEKINRMFAPAVCGSQAWLDRSITWEMKREMEERRKEEKLEKREKAREEEKELEREREIEKKKRRKR